MVAKDPETGCSVRRENTSEAGLSATSLSISLSNTDCFLAPGRRCPADELLASGPGPGEGGLQTEAPWPQTSLSHESLVTRFHSQHPSPPTRAHVHARSQTHMHVHARAHCQAWDLSSSRGCFVGAELHVRFRSFPSMNHVDPVQGLWPVTAWGSL